MIGSRGSIEERRRHDQPWPARLRLYATAGFLLLCLALGFFVRASGWRELFLALAAAVTVFSARQIDLLLAGILQRSTALESARAELQRTHAELTKTHAELEKQHARIQEARRETEALAGFLVHDMKSPIAGIKAMVELARKEVPPGSHAHRDLSDSIGLANRLLGMASDLLAILRLEAGQRAPLSRLTVVLRELLDDVRATVSARARQIGAEVIVREEKMLAAMIDPSLVQRMLENLAGNALRYVKRGDRIEIAAALEGIELALSVSNSGAPIPDSIRARLFEKHVSSRDERHNVGLGLYLCRLIAVAHGGTISLEDRAGWNVTFVARLPASLITAAPAARVATLQSRLVTPQPASPRGLRVLIADDEPQLLKALHRGLGSRHNVTVAGSGGEALSHLERGERFDVILSDIAMRDISGLGLFARLTKAFPEQAERVLFWSGGTPNEVTRAFLARMADRALTKDIGLENLEAAFGLIIHARGRHKSSY